MTLDEILTAYEDRWRQAALEGRGHWGRGGTACALSIDPALAAHAYIRLPWRCPSCGTLTRLLSGVAVHLHDDHRWTWLQFANKFRDVLAQGSR